MSREALEFEHYKAMWLWCEMRGGFQTSPAEELADAYWHGPRSCAQRGLAATYGSAH